MNGMPLINSYYFLQLEVFMSQYSDNISLAPKTMTKYEQMALLKVTGERRKGFRDHMIFSIALATGLREHEIAALNIGDVFNENGSPIRRVGLKTFKRSNNNPEHQEVFLNDKIRAKLKKFYSWKKKNNEPLLPNSPLFISRIGKRIATRTMRHMFKVWQERAGFEREFSFHQLRHTSCTNHMEKSGEITLTQRFARHKNINTTRIYTHPSDEKLLNSVQNLIC